jgi:isoleucyl-tRNA synthetase
VKTTAVRDQMLAENEKINWYPDHIKHGRFGDWLEGNVDWALSRERYWGTPLPMWQCGKGHERCVGSREELVSLAGAVPDDLHKPYIDEVTFACTDCGGEMRRVPEVIDAWWDSGSMPFAQWHAPFENEEEFQQNFPADYICEALDQTRGWFYSLLAVSTLLYGQSPYRTVLCLGLILDPEGQKMSKSRGNVVVPWDVISAHGADAMRWYYFTSKQPWDGYRFSLETVGESVRQFMLQLWNTYGFFVRYASLPDRVPGSPSDLDRWALSRLSATVSIAIERLDDYDTTSAGREIAAFVEDLSNWYVRLSRRRFWNGETAALETLETCLVTVAKLLAPLVPFVSDAIYENLDGSEPSVHLTDYPSPGARDVQLESDMAVARDAVELGRAARAAAKMKVRQPLSEVVVVAAGDERRAIERFTDLLLEDLNVKTVRFVTEAEELGRWELKPNYRALGPRFGKRMPAVAEAVAALDAQRAAATLRAGGSVGISVDGKEHPLSADDVQLVLQPLEGYRVERSGTHAVALNLELSEALRLEGLAREVVHAVQAARKSAGLNVEDRISLALGGDAVLLDAVRAHEDYVTGETLAVSLSYDGAEGDSVSIEGSKLRITVAR